MTDTGTDRLERALACGWSPQRLHEDMDECVHWVDTDGNAGASCLTKAELALADGSRFLSPAQAAEQDRLAADRLGRGIHEAAKVGGPWPHCPGEYGNVEDPCLCAAMASHALELMPAALAEPVTGESAR
jgi:hypothetical protein